MELGRCDGKSGDRGFGPGSAELGDIAPHPICLLALCPSQQFLFGLMMRRMMSMLLVFSIDASLGQDLWSCSCPCPSSPFQLLGFVLLLVLLLVAPLVSIVFVVCQCCVRIKGSAVDAGSAWT